MKVRPWNVWDGAWIVYGEPLPPPERGTHASNTPHTCPCPLVTDPAVWVAHKIEAIHAARWSKGLD